MSSSSGGSSGGLPAHRGMPMLSGPPPVVESSTCRQCSKEFNPLWRRSHACGHCGYEYCSSCLSDGQALMPRKGDSSASTSSNPFTALKEEFGLGERKQVMNGYEVESVCLPCLSMLQVTAAPLQILRSLPLKRLKEYIAAYDIPCVGPKEKEDFVQSILKARNPTTGCLSPESESYYRRKSVPKHGKPSATTNTVPRPSAARPRPPPPTNNNRPPPPHYAQARPPPPNHAYRTPPNQSYRPPPPRAAPTQNATPRPKPAPPPRQPSPPVPSILSLVSLPKSYLSSLSIGTLKAILYENHVKVDFKQVLEKDELIKRVSELITDERRRLERQAREEERLANGTAATTATGETGSSTPEGEGEGTDKKVPTGPMPEVERGLCVVCQDEEATLAVVDCGHLAMCSHCSDLIMATSQECPLCRTRIVTRQRLIRIYQV